MTRGIGLTRVVIESGSDTGLLVLCTLQQVRSCLKNDPDDLGSSKYHVPEACELRWVTFWNELHPAADFNDPGFICFIADLHANMKTSAKRRGLL